MTKPVGSSNERTKGIGLGLISSVEVVEDGATTAHSQSSNVTGTTMTRSLSASSSNEPGSPRFPVPAPFSVSSTPSSPIKSSFSSSQLPRLPSASTFTGFHEQPTRQDEDRSIPSADSETPSCEDSLPALSVDTSIQSLASTKGLNGTPYTRPSTKSLTLQSPQPHIRHNKTSLSALASIDHSGRFVHHLLGGVDPKDDTSAISVNIRFVSRDLWVKVDIPRNLSVLKARDLVLEKCQLTMTPPSASSPQADASVGDDEPALTASPTKLDEPSETAKDDSVPKDTLGNNEDQGSSKPTSSRSKTARGANKAASHSDVQPPRPDQSTSKSSKHKSGSENSEREGRRSHVSLSEEELQLKAAALVARLDMFAHSINGFGDEAAKINYAKAIVSLPPPKDKDKDKDKDKEKDKDKDKDQDGTNNQQGVSKGLQLKRLLSNTSVHDDVHSTSPPDRNRDGGAGRLGQIAGWGQWRDRKHSERDILDHIDLHMDFSKQGQGALSESSKKEFEDWKASFGLFWVAAVSIGVC